MFYESYRLRGVILVCYKKYMGRVILSFVFFFFDDSSAVVFCVAEHRIGNPLVRFIHENRYEISVALNVWYI